jgi:hypothetical protein
MVAMALTGGRKRKSHSKHKKLGGAKKVSVRVFKRKYVGKHARTDKLHKLGKVVKSGPRKGKRKLVLSKLGQKERAAQLARRGGSKKSKRSKKSKKR